MKNKKHNGHLLTEQEMKQVLGGYMFHVSQSDGRCPFCGEWVKFSIYSYYVTCPYCSCSIELKEKKEE